MYLSGYKLLCIKSCCWALYKLAMLCYQPLAGLGYYFCMWYLQWPMIEGESALSSDLPSVSQTPGYPDTLSFQENKNKRPLTYSYILPNSSASRWLQISLLWDLCSHYFSVLVTLYFFLYFLKLVCHSRFLTGNIPQYFPFAISKGVCCFSLLLLIWLTTTIIKTVGLFLQLRKHFLALHNKKYSQWKVFRHGRWHSCCLWLLCLAPSVPCHSVRRGICFPLFSFAPRLLPRWPTRPWDKGSF